MEAKDDSDIEVTAPLTDAIIVEMQRRALID